MSELRAKLMLREAVRYMGDAEHLRSRIDHESNGAYLLDLLALEVLLKCCVLIETRRLERGHDYVQLFLKLDRALREDLILAAHSRMGAIADYADVCCLLALYGSNFIRMRYPYEAYGGISEAEYFRLGAEWIERGAVAEEATFEYRPLELQGLLYALSAYASEKIAG